MLFYFKYYTTTSKNCCILTNYITTEKLRTNKYVEHLLPQNNQQSFSISWYPVVRYIVGQLLPEKVFMCLCRTYFLEQQQPKVQDETRFLFTFPTPSPFFYFLQLHFVKICCDIKIHWIASITWLNPLLFWILISISDHLMVMQMTYWWSVAD